MRILYIFFVSIVYYAMFAVSNAATKVQPLVTTDWLKSNLDQVFVLDVRKSKESFISKPVFEKNKKTGESYLTRVGGHIPGASFLLYKNVRGEQMVEGATIKHMLPVKSDFETLMQQTGLNNDDYVIIVTNAENDYDLNIAARVYWQLKYYGHKEISILDGGMAQWLIDQNEISTQPDKMNVGNWKVTDENKNILATSEDVALGIKESVQLIDVRPIGQYLGLHKSSKVQDKGHIPSAKSYPVELIANKGLPMKFLTPMELQPVTKALGIQEDVDSITYCNSGHMAAGGWFVMHAILGNENAKLYDGSMHQWTQEKRPVVSMQVE